MPGGNLLYLAVSGLEIDGEVLEGRVSPRTSRWPGPSPTRTVPIRCSMWPSSYLAAQANVARRSRSPTGRAASN